MLRNEALPTPSSQLAAPGLAMATETVARTREPVGNPQLRAENAPHDVETTLKYYDDPGDGTPPTPVVIGG